MSILSGDEFTQLSQCVSGRGGPQGGRVLLVFLHDVMVYRNAGTPCHYSQRRARICPP
jgi:hypothetical protein